MVMAANEIDAHVGQRMRRRRELLGVSQGRLGRHLGLTFSQVQKYEKGSNRIGAGRLFLLSDYLGVPVHYFFEGLRASQSAGCGEGGSGARDGEVAMLETAFLSIADRSTRQSVLALVCSLAAAAEQEEPLQLSTG